MDESRRVVWRHGRVEEIGGVDVARITGTQIGGLNTNTKKWGEVLAPQAIAGQLPPRSTEGRCSRWWRNCLGYCGLGSGAALWIHRSAPARCAKQGARRERVPFCDIRWIPMLASCPLLSLRRACASLGRIVFSVSLRPCSTAGTKGNYVMGITRRGGHTRARGRWGGRGSCRAGRSGGEACGSAGASPSGA